MIPIRVGFHCGRMDDAFVVDCLVGFVMWEGKQFICLRDPNNLVTLDDLGGSGFLEWFPNFIQYIVAYDLVTELGFSFRV